MTCVMRYAKVDYCCRFIGTSQNLCDMIQACALRLGKHSMIEIEYSFWPFLHGNNLWSHAHNWGGSEHMRGG